MLRIPSLLQIRDKQGGILKVGPPKKFACGGLKIMFLNVLEDSEAQKKFGLRPRILKIFACGALKPPLKIPIDSIKKSACGGLTAMQGFLNGFKALARGFALQNERRRPKF